MFSAWYAVVYRVVDEDRTWKCVNCFTPVIRSYLTDQVVDVQSDNYPLDPAVLGEPVVL